MAASAAFPTEVPSLPVEPLQGDQLGDILSADRVVEVWVPDPDRSPMSVVEWATDERGAILKFWVKFVDNYTAVKYMSPTDTGEKGWYRLEPITKDALEHELMASTIEGYRPLSERL